MKTNVFIRNLLLLSILIAPIALVSGQKPGQNDIRYKIENLRIDTRYKLDSLGLEAQNRISMLQLKYYSKIEALQLEASSKITKIQSAYIAKMNEAQQRAEKNPLLIGKLERELSEYDNELTAHIEEIEYSYSHLILTLGNEYEIHSSEIENKYQLQSDKIEMDYNLIYKNLEVELNGNA